MYCVVWLTMQVLLVQVSVILLTELDMLVHFLHTVHKDMGGHILLIIICFDYSGF